MSDPASVVDLAGLEATATAALRHNPTGVWERTSPETWIWASRHDGDHMHIADIRGWGDLTGRGGGLALDEDEAFATQKAWGDHIAAANPATVLSLIEQIKSLQAERDALREVLTTARAALHHHYVEWDGEPEDAVALQLARAECDAALAMQGEGS